jgi:tellurite resistance protein TerC
MFKSSWRFIWRYTKIIAGIIVLIVGIAMIVLPGPAFIVIPVGLGILATELKWAKDILEKVKDEIIIISKIKGVKAQIIYCYNRIFNNKESQTL